MALKHGREKQSSYWRITSFAKEIVANLESETTSEVLKHKAIKEIAHNSQLPSQSWLLWNECMHSPKTDTLKPYFLWDGIRRWDFGICLGFNEVMRIEPVMTGIRTLIIMTRELAPSAWLPIIWGRYDESQQSTTRKSILTRIWQCWHPDHGFADLRTVRNKFVLVISHVI